MIVGSRSNNDKSMCFYDCHRADHPDRSSRSDGHDMFETVHDGHFHRNRRSFRSDGYAQKPIKRCVLPMFKPVELEINLIELSRHLPSRFS